MGTKNATQTVQQSVPSWVSDAYKKLISGAQTTMANHPYTPYTGGFEPDQQTAFQNIGNMAGSTDQTFQNANTAANNALVPAYQNVQQYMNPYVGNVVNATMANMNELNGQQQQGVIGNAIAKGAYGGNRVGVAQSELARQQNLANQQTIAGLYNDAYSSGLGAAQQQQQTGLAGASALAGIGSQQMNTGLTQAAAQLGAGTQQQQYNYQQFLNQQGFPYQQQSWLSGVINGTGPNAGGTTTQTSPQGNIFSSLLGAGLGIASLFKDGGVVRGYAGGGGVHPYANDNREFPYFSFSGEPYANDNSIYMPYMPIDDTPPARSSFPELDKDFGKDKNDDILKQYSSLMKEGAGNVKDWLTGMIHPDLGLASGGSARWRKHIANGNESDNIEDRRRVGDPIAGLIRMDQYERMQPRYMSTDHFSHDPSMPSDRFARAGGGVVRGYDGGGMVQGIYDFLQAPYKAREAAGQVVTPGPVDWGGIYKALQAPYEARQARLAASGIGASFANDGYSGVAGKGDLGISTPNIRPSYSDIGPGLSDQSSGMAGGWNQFDDQFGSSSPSNPNSRDVIIDRPPPQTTKPYTTNEGGNSIDIARLGLTNDPFKSPAQKAIEIAIHGGAPIGSAFTGGWGNTGLYANEADEAADKKINPALVPMPRVRPAPLFGFGPGAGGFATVDPWGPSQGNMGLRIGPASPIQGLVTGAAPAAITVNGGTRQKQKAQPGPALNVTKNIDRFLNAQDVDTSRMTAGEQANAFRKSMGKLLADGGVVRGYAGGGAPKKKDDVSDLYEGLLEPGPQGGIVGGALIPPLPLVASPPPDDLSGYTANSSTPDDLGQNQPPPSSTNAFSDIQYDPAMFGNDNAGVVPYTRGDQFQTTPDPQYSQNIGDAFHSLQSGNGLNLSPDFRQALLAAGLGMMASKSPFALQGIGEGGLKGIETWNARQALERENAKTRADIAQKGQELATTAAQTKANLGLTGAQAGATQYTFTTTPAGIQVTNALDPHDVKFVPWGGLLPDGTVANPVSAATAGAPSLFSTEAPKAPVDRRLMSNATAPAAIEQGNTAVQDARKGQQAALQASQQLQEMQHSLDQLGDSGFLTQGAGFPDRVHLAKVVNTAFQAMGIEPPFDPNQVAAGEDLNKVTTRLGFALSQGLGSNNAASIVDDSISAVPGGANSKQGAERIINALEAINRRQIDYYNFIQKWSGQNNGSVLGADEYFNAHNPPELYALSAYVPMDAMNMLRNNPELAPQFNQKYGKGRDVAKYVLGR